MNPTTTTPTLQPEDVVELLNKANDSMRPAKDANADPEITDAMPLPDIVNIIKTRLTSHGESAWLIGKALLKAKPKVKQAGFKWQAWLQENFSFSLKTAQRYMNVGVLDRDTTANKLLGELYDPKGKPKKPKVSTTEKAKSFLETMLDQQLTAIAQEAGQRNPNAAILRQIIVKFLEAMEEASKPKRQNDANLESAA